MIYLIDDKKIRQAKDYSWTSALFEKYKDSVQLIYSLEELNPLKPYTLAEWDTILYHESFLDGTSKKEDAKNFRERIKEQAEKRNLLVAFFSGSTNDRKVDKNIAHLPVSIMYQNLDIYIEKGSNNLDYLLYGKNIRIEKELMEDQAKALNKVDSECIPEGLTGKHLFFKPQEGSFRLNSKENFEENNLFNDSSDKKIITIIENKLSKNKYDSIIIPLCFGAVLSDFNGLRFATHIRCTKTINQCTNIYIYAFADYSYLLKEKYFNILKTKNVEMIGFSKNAIANAVKNPKEELTEDELPKEISKLNLTVPKNYNDNHSIANEWCIYRWSTYLKIENDALEEKIKYSLYYNYLKTIYPIEEIESKDLRVWESGKVLLIDDEKEKGWHSFLKKIMCQPKFVSIGESFKEKSKEDIIKESKQKVEEFKPDVVILDLRLHERDFDTKESEELTGIKILQEIKKINRGIQVLAFTASNKVWNFQKMQQYGVDGFILKESPELSQESNFTRQAVTNLKNSIEAALRRSYLRLLYDGNQKIFKKLDELNSDFTKEIKNQLSLAYYLLEVAKNKEQFAYAYVSLYMVIEVINNEYCIETNNKWEIRDVGSLFNWKWNNKKYINNKEEIYVGEKAPAQWQKFAGIYLQKWEKDNSHPNHAEIRKVQHLIKMRNQFVHTKEMHLKVEGEGFEINIDTHQGYVKLFNFIKDIMNYL